MAVQSVLRTILKLK